MRPFVENRIPLDGQNRKTGKIKHEVHGLQNSNHCANIHELENGDDDLIAIGCMPAFCISIASGLALVPDGDNMVVRLRPGCCTDAALARLKSKTRHPFSSWPGFAPSVTCLIRAATSLDSSLILNETTFRNLVKSSSLSESQY